MPVSKMWESIEALIQASLNTAKDHDGGPYPVYPSGKSRDETSREMGSGEKFYNNVISEADSGCNDELMNNSFAFCRENWPMHGGQLQQHLISSRDVELAPGSVTRYRDVSTDNEQTLMSSVARQPVSIAIETDQYSFQLYSSGVFIASCGTHLDHGVSAVGYGSEGWHRLLEGAEFVGKFVV